MNRGFFTKVLISIILTFLVSISCVGSKDAAREENSNTLYNDPSKPIPERVEDLLSRMTLFEKIGQMTQAERGTIHGNDGITEYAIGSVLSGGGSGPSVNDPAAWADMYDLFQRHALDTRLGIPLIYGIDAVHGHNTVYGAVVFPHNIGLGATRDPALVEEIGRITAIEVAATGIDWTFAPCIAVPLNERWGRTYEGFSEYTPLAGAMGAAAIKGYQGADFGSDPKRILACAKHFAGDGGTKDGIDQGDTIISDEEFRRIHLPQYKEAIEAGVESIMASFNSHNGKKMHGHKYWITDVLKGEMGFKGIIVSDWEGIEKIGPRYVDNVKQAINAGIDMAMVPTQYQRFMVTVKSLVEKEEIPVSRIDDAVRRILTIKFKMGLFEETFTDRSLLSTIGEKKHRTVGRDAVRKSLVLLKNDNRILPLSKHLSKVFVAGKNANDIGNQCGGWTMTWQGQSGNITRGTTILEGIREVVENSETTVVFDEFGLGAEGSDVAIVVIGEYPYAEMMGDKENLNISLADVKAIDNCRKAGVPVVVVLVSGRPMIVTPYLDDWEAFVAAWLPGTEGAGIADVLFGDYNPTGKLSYTWPETMEQIPINYGDDNYDPLFPFDYGLSYN